MFETFNNHKDKDCIRLMKTNYQRQKTGSGVYGQTMIMLQGVFSRDTDMGINVEHLVQEISEELCCGS